MTYELHTSPLVRSVPNADGSHEYGGERFTEKQWSALFSEADPDAGDDTEATTER